MNIDEPTRRRPSRAPWAVVGVVVLVLVGGASWGAWSLSQPVTRAGVPSPTGALPTVPIVDTSTPVATGSATAANSSASPKATPTPKPPTPTPKPSPTPTSTVSYSSLAIGAANNTGTAHRYIVAVGNDTQLSANAVAQTVAGTLNDPRGWAGSGTMQFSLVKTASSANVTILVADDATASRACGNVPVCVTKGTVMIDASAWNQAAPTYANDATGFQQYLVNHGVGLWLGQKTASCPGAGKPAPVMAAQDADLRGCTANPWVYP